MSPDAKLRMDVYQEGQRAWGVGMACPHTDWRAGTWQKGRKAAVDHQQRMIEEVHIADQRANETDVHTEQELHRFAKALRAADYTVTKS
jgi:hypothetical protein